MYNLVFSNYEEREKEIISENQQLRDYLLSVYQELFQQAKLVDQKNENVCFL